MESEDIRNKSMDITELICQLQQEKLLVDTERSNLELLNEELVDYTNKLIKATWINAQQRVNLNSLVARPDYTPEQCCRRSVALANCTFIPAKELYDHQTLSNFSQFISLLRNRTEQFAQWIVIGERLSKDTPLFCQILQTIIAGLYGSLLLPEDINMSLNLLQYLARFQLVTTDNPRRKLSQGSCAFSKMYLLFHESLPSAKLFLIAALQHPILQLIANTHEYLDIDPDKTIQRLSILERYEKFGPQGTLDYEAKVSEFRESVLDQLTSFAHSFICAIQENIYCFPSTLASLIKHIIQMIAQSFGEHSKEVSEISTDLMFTLYICPAIVNPEPYGVCDAPISPAARHNLIQVSQLLQRLALLRTNSASAACNGSITPPLPGGEEETPLSPMHRLLQQRCDGGSLADVVGVLLEGMDETRCSTAGVAAGVQRDFVVLTEYELNNLVSFLVKAHNTTLEDLGGVNETASSASDMHQDSGGGDGGGSYTTLNNNNNNDVDNDQFFALLTKLPTSENGSSGGSNGSGSSPRNSGLALHNGIVGENSSNGGGRGTSGGRRQILMNKVTGSKPSSHHHHHHLPQQHHLRTSSSSESTSDEPNTQQPLTVLLIPLLSDRQVIGLLPENKVLSMAVTDSSDTSSTAVAERNLIEDSVVDISKVDNNGSSSGAVGEEISDNQRLDPSNSIVSTGQERRTRFSTTEGEGSIGNTSDNLEAISEAASNHSVASSMELEDHDDDDDDDDGDDDDDDDDIVGGQNDGDNLSDMVSANVSGRGSPNISGRDTPSSQVTENEDRSGAGVVGIEVGVAGIAGDVRPANHQQHVLNIKQSILRHSDIDDKFCKFEIKQQLLPATADETVSIISDTWSTDVLASDSETVDVTSDNQMALLGSQSFVQQQQHRIGGHFSPIVEQPPTACIVGGVGLLDMSETQSESAWSTDVLVASDTDRLTEVDNDDLASVAPSDDTASVAPSETDEGPPPLHQLLLLGDQRKLSTASTSNYSTISSYEYAHQLDLHVTSANVHGVLSGRGDTNDNSSRAPPQKYSVEDGDIADGVDGGRVSHPCDIAAAAAFVPYKIDDGSVNSAVHSIRSSRTEVVNGGGILVTSHTITSSSNTVSGHRLPALPPPLIPTKVSGSAPSYLLVKNISAQKYEATADSQLSNTSLNSSSSGSSSGGGGGHHHHHHTKLLLPMSSGGVGGNHHGKWKQIWGVNDGNSSSPGPLNESASPDDNNTCSQINTTPGAVGICGRAGAGKNNTLVNGLLNGSSSKPTAASGAIPKSISFDMSAEKGDKDHSYDDQKTRRGSSGIFGKLKLNLRSRRGKTSSGVVVRDEFHGERSSRAFTDHVILPVQNNSEISEDILAKYRRNGSSTSHPKKNNGSTTLTNLKPSKILELDDNDNQLILIESDPNSINCALEDAKKKLRIILSHSKGVNFIDDGRQHSKKDLETFLQLEMAKAKHFKQWSTAAQISETLRCIKLLDLAHFYKLCDILQSDYCNRKVYTQYLMHSRQILLCSHSFLEELTEQVERESELCSSFLLSICVRLYLDRYNQIVQEFTAEFKRLTLVDEKHELLSTFLKNLYAQMRKDSIWQDASCNQIEQSQVAVERSVMTEVYVDALHPNGDMDRARDRMLNEHLARLGGALTPDHKDLQIGAVFRREAPWMPAQEALRALAAYRSARDKVRCVTRCAGAIMALLSLGQHGRGSTTAADDFVPVLVYVIIKTNPHDLLSTIQYVKSFYGTQLRGEEEYWWTQFCSAVEFTKTMEYSD